ncbi:MAG: ABC transporter ATP-binding protein [Brevinemataceae bacterium]
MNSQNPTVRLFHLLTHYKLYVCISLFAACLFVAGRTGVSLFIGEFINNIFISQNYSSVSLHNIVILFGFGFLWSGAQYLMYLFSGKLAVRIAYRLRKNLYGKFVKLPIPYYHTHDSSHMLSVASNDITLVETFLMNIMVQLIAQPLTVVVIVSTMFVLNWKLSLYFLLLGPAIAFLLGIIGIQVQKLGKNLQENAADITKIFAESIRHIQVIKGFNSENTEIQRFNSKNKTQLELADKEIKIRLLALPMSDFLGITAVILLLSLGAVGIKVGIATAGDVTKFVAMAIVLSEPISSFNQLILVVKKLGPAAQRIFNIIDTPDELCFESQSIGDINGQIEFKNVSFAYNSHKQTLHNINLSISSGETIAVIGLSGSGKSTLISLIPKFYSPEQGQILIDNKDISLYNAASIRNAISIVTQDTSLFSDTIFNNISLSKPEASLNEITSAAETANAHQFITAHPEGYQRYVGNNGNNLSGGERQRIILARAILKKPSILLLDEPTSALDNDSEKLVTQALENIYGKQTTIIIAHKLNTVKKADKIIVMKNGHIIETGTHHELSSFESSYKQLLSAETIINS